MQGSKEWRQMFKEITGKDIVYEDRVSIFFEYGPMVVGVEEHDHGLQLQCRKSCDSSDIVVAENIICDNRIVGSIAHTNYDKIKKLFAEFISKI